MKDRLDRLDQDTPLAELPRLINRSVALMLADAVALLASVDVSRVPAEKIRTAIIDLEQQFRSAEETRLREAWLDLHDAPRADH